MGNYISPTEELIGYWASRPNVPTGPIVLLWLWGGIIHVFDSDLGYTLPVTGGHNHTFYGRVTGWKVDDTTAISAWIEKLDRRRGINRNVSLVVGLPLSWAIG